MPGGRLRSADAAESSPERASGTLESRLKAQAYGLGFDLAGITDLTDVQTHDAFERWLAKGYHGEMAYLERGADLRRSTTVPEPGMRSAIVVGFNYGGRQPDGPIAKYARGDDYHRIMWDKLEDLLKWIREESGSNLRGRACVDTGPILERDLARKAGLGWFGKNTLLINPQIGSFFFIGALFLELDLLPDSPFTEEHCGTCTRCLDACPTQAFPEARVLDARRCISYLTIELRGDIPEEYHEVMGNHLYGCDICQDVCPWNRKFASEPRPGPIAPRGIGTELDTLKLATTLSQLNEEEYQTLLRRSPMKRAKLAGLKRNANVVLSNFNSTRNAVSWTDTQ